MTPLEAEKEENELNVRQTYWKKYFKAEEKERKPKFSVRESVRIYKERGTFHQGYMEDFTVENFTISEVFTNLPVPKYKRIQQGRDFR